MTWAICVYRILLRCYPAAFREEYGDQMRRTFVAQLCESQRAGDLLEQFALGVQAIRDVLIIAPKEHWHVIFEDVRYALRVLAASPGFAAVAILSLALGIGANTAIFNLWNGVLHSSLPAVHKPKELVILSNPGSAGVEFDNVRGDRNLLTYAEFEQLRDHARNFSGIMASQSGLASLPVRLPGGEWEEAHERLVSGAYFQVLAVSPVIGRVFTAEDDRAALPHAVISYEYWQRRFGGSSDTVGSIIDLSKVALTIIGVAPPGFIGETAGQQPDMWIPLRMQTSVVPTVDWLHDTPPHKVMWLHVFGRLRPGVTLKQAEAEVNTIFKTGLESFYGSVTSAQRRRELLDQHIKIQPGARGASGVRNGFSTSLTAMLAAGGLLLLIACANLANLLLARGTGRKPEIALRLSLGASRGRLMRQLVTESLVLAVIGGFAGLALAYLLYSVLVQMIVLTEKTFRMSFTLNPLILVFTLAVTLAAAILFGLMPAWQVTKTDLGTGLKEQSRGSTGRIGRMNWGRSLVILQLALCVPLLVGAGLLLRTLYNLQHVNLGYSTRHLLLVGSDFLEMTHDEGRRGILLRELLEQFQRIPGVRAASFSQMGLFSGDFLTSRVEVEGFVTKRDGDRASALDRVGPGYFSTLGVPITLGREILEQDSDGAPQVCVINQAFAKQFFAGRNPIGMRVTSIGVAGERTVYQVVGVAQNARTQSLRGEIEPRYFVAEEQNLSSTGAGSFLIRTSIAAAPVLAAVRRAFRGVDATLPMDSAHSVEEQIAPLTAQERTTAQLAMVFGGVALTLAAIGLYGVLSYAVARRKSEIAIRIAVGAKPSGVIMMILRETSVLVMAGVAVGAGFAYIASRLINSRLYGVVPQDPLTLLLATTLLLLVAFSAAYLPARRASNLDPIEALRRE